MQEIKAVRVYEYDALGDGNGFVPGRYMLFADKDWLFILPCGHAFRPDGRWSIMDAPDGKISLHPSIACSPQVPCWHGWLIDGIFRKA